MSTGAEEKPSEPPLDRVTQLQNSIDALSVQMLEALRQLPRHPDPRGTGSATAEAASAHGEAVRGLAAQVLQTAQTVDGLIESLPGLSQSPEEQLEDLRALAAESAAAGEELRAAHADAEGLGEELRSALTRVSGDRLAGVSLLSSS